MHALRTTLIDNNEPAMQQITMNRYKYAHATTQRRAHTPTNERDAHKHHGSNQHVNQTRCTNRPVEWSSWGRGDTHLKPKLPLSRFCSVTVRAKLSDIRPQEVLWRRLALFPSQPLRWVVCCRACSAQARLQRQRRRQNTRGVSVQWWQACGVALVLSISSFITVAQKIKMIRTID